MRNCTNSVLLRLLVLVMALWGVGAFAQTTDGSMQEPYGAQTATQSSDQRAVAPVRSEAGFPIAGSAIYPGDLLDITTFGVPELTTRTRVSREGDIYLPLIG